MGTEETTALIVAGVLIAGLILFILIFTFTQMATYTAINQDEEAENN